MADGPEMLRLTLVYGSTKHKVELACSSTGDAPTVADLNEVAAQVTQVPENAQKLIYKGQSFKDKAATLESLGVKQGAKIMLIGKKYDPEEEESMKAIRLMEKKTDDLEKKLQDLLRDFDDVQKGFLEARLVDQSLENLVKKVKATEESLMKLLESLDALLLDSSANEVRQQRKTLVQRIQVLLDKTDSTTVQITELLPKSR